jgi:hypothetical protein
MGNYRFAHRADHPVEDTDVKQLILETYQPKRCVFHNSKSEWIEMLRKQYENKATRNTAQIRQIAGMFRGIYEVNQLRKMYSADTGVKYDKVIRCRFDTEFMQDVLADTMQDELSLKLGYTGICDQLFWGNPNTMNVAMDWFLHIGKVADYGSFENSEGLFSYYLKQIGVPYTIREDIKFALNCPGRVRTVN